MNCGKPFENKERNRAFEDDAMCAIAHPEYLPEWLLSISFCGWRGGGGC